MINIKEFDDQAPKSLDLSFSNPKFVKDLSDKELTSLADKIRDEVVFATSVFGGHLSSNLGVVEATIALHRSFDFPKDKLLFDVGHQAYAHKILTGRSLDALRTKNGVSGFQKRAESAYDQFEAGHSSTSLSAALGMAIARDLNKEDYEVIAFIGDASISNGEAFEALNHIGQLNHKVIVILNDNEMSITRPIGSMSKMFRKWRLSPNYIKSKNAYKRLLFRTRIGYGFYRFTWMLKNFFVRHLFQKNIFEQMGFNYVGLVDGHSFSALNKAFKQAKRSTKSIVIHLKTSKGKGYSYSENDKNGDWHGVAPFIVSSGKSNSVISANIVSWSKLYAQELMLFMEEVPDSVLINPATIKGSELEALFSRFSSRCYDTGIAEMHALSLASGIALNSKFPIVSIYSTFMQRAFDQILHDLARMRLPSLVLVDRAGFVGADGETHQGLYDEAFLLNTPDVIVSMAANSNQASALLETVKTAALPFFIRYPRANVIRTKDKKLKLTIGRWLTYQKGKSKNLALVGFGPVLDEVFLKVKALDLGVYNAIFQKPMDERIIRQLLKYREVFIFDAYATSNGFIFALTNRLVELGYRGKIITQAPKDDFYTQDSVTNQMRTAKVDAESITKAIKRRLRHYDQ